MPNLIAFLCGIGEDILTDISGGAEAWLEELRHVRRQLWYAVGLPFGLFLLAMLIGGFGQSESADGAARAFMDAACLIACPLFAAVAFNLVRVGQLLVLASIALHRVSGDVIPQISEKRAGEASRAVFALVTWISVVCSIAMFVPMWRSVHFTVVIMVTSFALAGIMMTWGMRTLGIKYIASALVLCMMLGGILQFVPEFKRFGLGYSAKQLARLDQVSEKNEADAKAIKNHEAVAEDKAGDDMKPAGGPNGNAATKQHHQPIVDLAGDVADAPNANAAPPTLGQGDDTADNAGAAPDADGGKTSAPARKTQPLKRGEVADQIDQLFPDLGK